MNIKQLEHSLSERVNAILATGLLAQVILKNIEELQTSNVSPTRELLQQITPLLPDKFTNNHRLKNIPEAKVLCFIDSQNFITLISEVDAFIYDVLVHKLTLHPKNISKRQVSMEKIINSTSIDEVIHDTINSYVDSITRESSKKLRSKLIDLLGAGDNFLEDEWQVYADAKARRNAGVHNGWKVDAEYRQKIGCNHVETNSDYLTITSEYLLPTQAKLIKLMKKILEHCKQNLS